jgi:hypothetical protein
VGKSSNSFEISALHMSFLAECQSMYYVK